MGHLRGRDTTHWLDVQAGDALLIQAYASNGIRIRCQR